jgi:hypothetical protein
VSRFVRGAIEINNGLRKKGKIRKLQMNKEGEIKNERKKNEK